MHELLFLLVSSCEGDRLPLRTEAAGEGEEGGGRRQDSLLAWFSSAQVFVILNKCAVSYAAAYQLRIKMTLNREIRLALSGHLPLRWMDPNSDLS